MMAQDLILLEDIILLREPTCSYRLFKEGPRLRLLQWQASQAKRTRRDSPRYRGVYQAELQLL